MLGLRVQIVGQYDRKALLEYIIISHRPIYGQGHLMLHLSVCAIEGGRCLGRYSGLEGKDILALGQLQLRSSALAVHIFIAAVVDLRGGIRLQCLDQLAISTRLFDTLLPTRLHETVHGYIDGCKGATEESESRT